MHLHTEGRMFTDDSKPGPVAMQRPAWPDLLTNAVHVTGRLTRDPETRTLPDGSVACDLRLAVDRPGADDVTGIIDIATFGRTASSCASVLTEGWLVAVAGQLDYRECLGSEGSRHGVIGDVVSPLGFCAAPRVVQAA
jgi:single-strand DNA-binding protein